MPPNRSKLAVVGHVEWVTFARVPRVPATGAVVHAQDAFAEPAGGGAVAAVQLARLAGAAVLVTALGDDADGRASSERLRALGVDVHARIEPAPASTRTAVTLVDDAGERTIVTFGPRLEPHGAALEPRGAGTPADALAASDAVYFTAGDLAALRAARESARVLVANPRARDALGHGVPLDALVLSGEDDVELRALAETGADAELVVFTEGARGGRYRTRSGEEGRWSAAARGGEIADAYGCGDSFAAGLTYGLGARLRLTDALELAARCGAACLTGRGPYERQLTAADL